MKYVLAFLLSAILAGCDSGGSSGGVRDINLECMMIAGDYNTPVEIAGTKENMAISIRSDCTFSTRSPSTGESYGKLQSVGNSTYHGSGKSPACSGGTFSVTVKGSKYSGFSFSAQCN